MLVQQPTVVLFRTSPGTCMLRELRRLLLLVDWWAYYVLMIEKPDP